MKNDFTSVIARGSRRLRLLSYRDNVIYVGPDAKQISRNSGTTMVVIKKSTSNWDLGGSNRR